MNESLFVQHVNIDSEVTQRAGQHGSIKQWHWQLSNI